jgi:hypothetical protein
MDLDLECDDSEPDESGLPVVSKGRGRGSGLPGKTEGDWIEDGPIGDEDGPGPCPCRERRRSAGDEDAPRPCEDRRRSDSAGEDIDVV